MNSSPFVAPQQALRIEVIDLDGTACQTLILDQVSSSWTVGRSRANPIALSDPSRTISGIHGKFFWQDEELYYQDISANGSYLNQKLNALSFNATTKIKHADIVFIHNYALKIHLPWEPKPPTTPPEQRPDSNSSEAMDHKPAEQDEHLTPALPTNLHQMGDWEAFCSGLGIDPQKHPTPADHKELLFRGGSLLKCSIEGLLQNLELRSKLKAEISATMTTIEKRDNNPLKFVNSPKEALKTLFGPVKEGHLTPVNAIRSAHRDIGSHSINVTLGGQMALSHLLSQLAPNQVSFHRGANPIKSWLHQKSLWAKYCKRYRNLEIENQPGKISPSFARSYCLYDRKYSQQRDRNPKA